MWKIVLQKTVDLLKGLDPAVIKRVAIRIGTHPKVDAIITSMKNNKATTALVLMEIGQVVHGATDLLAEWVLEDDEVRNVIGNNAPKALPTGRPAEMHNDPDMRFDVVATYDKPSYSSLVSSVDRLADPQISTLHAQRENVELIDQASAISGGYERYMILRAAFAQPDSSHRIYEELKGWRI